MIRPELRAAAYRWREAIYAGMTVLAGLWLISLGGLILIPAGLALVALGVAWAVSAWRRSKFAQDVEAPGLIEVDEGQIGYMGPTFGGYVALPDLVELRLMTLQGRRLWRLRQADGQALLIPVDAAGAERLFDAFAALPGIDMAAVVAALQDGSHTEQAGSASGRRLTTGMTTGLTIAEQSRLVWRHPGEAGLPQGLQPFDDPSYPPRTGPLRERR